MAKLLADGWDVTDAYRRAYSTKRRNVHREAHDIGKRIQVCQYVTALRAQKKEVDLHDGQVARDFIAKQLHDMAMNSDRDSDKLKALELFGKLDYVGAYRERADARRRDADARTAQHIASDALPQSRRNDQRGAEAALPAHPLPPIGRTHGGVDPESARSSGL